MSSTNEENSNSNSGLIDAVPGGNAPQYPPPFGFDSEKPEHVKGQFDGFTASSDSTSTPGNKTRRRGSSGVKIPKNSGADLLASGETLDSRREQGYGKGNDVGA